LTLAEAVQLTIANNFDIKIEKLKVEAAKKNNNLGQAGFFPNINLSLAYGNDFRDVVNPASFIQGVAQNTSLLPAINLNYTFFDGFKMFAQKDKLQQTQMLAEGNLSLLIENNIYSVIQAYYQVLSIQTQLKTLNEVLIKSRKNYLLFQEKKKIGVAGSFDFFQIESEYLNDSLNFVTLQTSKEKLLNNLNVLIGNIEDKVYTINDTLMGLSGNFTINDVEKLVLSQNRNLKNLMINKMLAESELKTSKADRLPTLTFNAGYNVNYSTQDLSRSVFITGRTGDANIKAETQNYFFNFTLNYPLFRGGQTNNRIKTLKHQTEQIELQNEKLKLSLKNELESNVIEYENRKKINQLSETVYQGKLVLMQLADERLKAGTISSIEHSQIKIAYLNANQNLIFSRLNVILSELELMRLSGTLKVDLFN
jgi:outer membrane protein TolC